MADCYSCTFDWRIMCGGYHIIQCNWCLFRGISCLYWSGIVLGLLEVVLCLVVWLCWDCFAFKWFEIRESLYRKYNDNMDI